MNENITPPCDCIELVDGAYVSRCYCSNSGDHAEAVSWCAEQATAKQIAALTARVKELEEALREIEAFGHGNGHGRGYTCAEMAEAALNKEPTHESRCTCNDAPPIHKIPGESFDDEAMRHYENLDHYREHCPLHGRFVNKEPTT